MRLYAALHVRSDAEGAGSEIAGRFSPEMEVVDEATVVFAIDPLRKLIGSPHQIAAEICRAGDELKVRANLAIAANIDTAILLARNTVGVVLVTPGDEAAKLDVLPLMALALHAGPQAAPIVEQLQRWGVHTCGELSALQQSAIIERFGSMGGHLHKLARGVLDRPLNVLPGEREYRAHSNLDYAVETLEPLLFVFGRLLRELCARMESEGCAAQSLTAIFEFPAGKESKRVLQFPVPMRDAQTMLKLLQLDCERNPLNAQVTAVGVELQATAPKRAQSGFFVPVTPAPDKLQITVSRIAGLVGPANIGVASLPNTHRPDAFETYPMKAAFETRVQRPNTQVLRIAMRVFRPALEARVGVNGTAPAYVKASGVRGNVVQCAGPWKTSGDWWAQTHWDREEWDVALDDGALYRICLQRPNESWYVAGVYD